MQLGRDGGLQEPHRLFSAEESHLSISVTKQLLQVSFQWPHHCLLSPDYLGGFELFTCLRVGVLSRSSMHPSPAIQCLAHKTGWLNGMSHNKTCHRPLHMSPVERAAEHCWWEHSSFFPAGSSFKWSNLRSDFVLWLLKLEGKSPRRNRKKKRP